MKVCPVCRGDRKITLPLFHYTPPSPFSASAANLLEARVDRKSYPCPECQPVTEGGGVRYIAAHARVDMREVGHPSYETALKAELARAIADELLKQDAIIFDRETDCYADIFATALLGVVDKHLLDSLDKRAKEHGLKMLSGVAEQAARDIRNWGSFYGQSEVSKDRAVEAVKKAVRDRIKAVHE